MRTIYKWLKVIFIPAIGILMPLVFYSGDNHIELFSWCIFSILITYMAWELGNGVSNRINKKYPIESFALKHILTMLVFFLGLSLVIILMIYLVNVFFNTTGPEYWSDMKGIHLIIILCTFMLTSVHEGIYIYYNWKELLKKKESIKDTGTEISNDLLPENKLGDSNNTEPSGYKDNILISHKGKDAPRYRKQFTIRLGRKIRIIKSEDIAYFYATDKAVYLKDFSGRDHLLDYTLKQLTELLDPEMFLRINRKFIINISAIDELVALSKSRLKVLLKPVPPSDIILNYSKSSELKQWLDR